MATRIIHLDGTLAAGAGFTELAPALTPPEGLRWTIVELRPTFQRDGTFRGFFDTELYHEIEREDVVALGEPHIVALDVVQPHAYHVFFNNRDAALTNRVGIDITVEEAPV